MATMAGGSKPLRLKDLLELDCESCSAAGFRCYPRRLCVAGAAVATASSSPMRHLLDADALGRFARSPSTRRSKLLSLSKSLSRRLRGGFWRRRAEEEAAAAAAATSSPAAAVSTCSCSSDSETSESSNSTQSQSESEFSSASSDSLHAGEPSTTGDEHEVRRRESKEEEEVEEIAGSSSEADDKEQLSPVGVMDFPFDDDDGGAVVEGEEADTAGACSASFSDSLALLQRRKTQLPHKIRRLGSKGELGSVDLEARFAASMSDDAPVQLRCSTDATAASPRSDEYSLLDLLVDTVSVGVDDVTERLLLDFFVETRCSRRTHATEFHGLTGLSHEVKRQDSGGASLRLAKAWLEGAGTSWSLDDVVCHGEAVMAGMERSRRWLHTGEEQGETGVVVAAMVIDLLVHELVSDLVG
ncbi:hypothetical protein ABZP36_010140 [Zizania latifolia]